MARSMSLPLREDVQAMIPSQVTIRDEKHNRYFEVFRRGSDIFQSEYELSSGGKDVFRDTQKIAYVIGSGGHGMGFFVRRGDYLFEAPLSYYAKTKCWDLSPGYDLGDYGFSRPVTSGCVACHSGRPSPEAGELGRYHDPPFRELSIGCENCHGPGELHVRERAQGVPVAGSLDTAIVNPAKLSGWLADNICMTCHQAGDTRVLQPGKNYLDFRPGTALDDTVGVFAVPLTPASPPTSPLLEQYSLMKLSRCFTASSGRMSCLTCHDPHVQPRSQVSDYYRQRCLTCHSEKSCSLPLPVREAKVPPDDCAGCHMPTRPLTSIAHSVLTDHRITARQGEPYPEAAFRQTSPELPDLVHVNAIPGRKDTVSPLTLFRAYGELESSHPEYGKHFLPLLKQLKESAPNDPLVLSTLALESLSARTPAGGEGAIGYWSRAIQSGSNSTADYLSLGSLLAGKGRISEAVSVLELGININPFSQELYRCLAKTYITAHRYTQALEALTKGLEVFPEDDAMRSFVKSIEESESLSTHVR
jgi:hypothetical protein